MKGLAFLFWFLVAVVAWIAAPYLGVHSLGAEYWVGFIAGAGLTHFTNILFNL